MIDFRFDALFNLQSIVTKDITPNFKHPLKASKVACWSVLLKRRAPRLTIIGVTAPLPDRRSTTVFAISWKSRDFLLLSDLFLVEIRNLI